MPDSKEIKKIVQEKYTDIVVASNKSCGCCGSTEPEYSVFNESYKGKEGYFEDADLGLGCGLPTEFADLKPGESVLDLGSGAGNDCFVARREVGENGSVTGLDFTTEMVEKAIKNNEKLAYSNVSFVLGDIEKMPFENSRFDVVISNCVLNLVPDKEKAFSEISRVLKPNGRICVSDIVVNGNLPEKIRNAAALYAGCVSGALLKEEYIAIIEKSGFEKINVRKEREILVPDEMYLQHVEKEELDKLKKSGTGIFSITLTAEIQ